MCRGRCVWCIRPDTGGHCALLAEDAGVLFAGDSLATVSFLDGRLGPQLVAFNEDAAAARQSLSRLEGLSARDRKSVV